MSEKKRAALCVTATILGLLVVFTLFVVYYTDKVERDNAWLYDFSDVDPFSQPATEDMLNINEVDFDTLSRTDSVGRKAARDIISYREQIGGYSSMSQLNDIPSVDYIMYCELCEHFYIGDYKGVQTNQSDDEKININTASKRELMSVDGITEEIASDIIRYREMYGDFVALNELTQVSSMTSRLYGRIADKLTV